MRLRTDESVAHVFARQARRECQTGWQNCRHVLAGMHGDVDRTVHQRLFDLLGEQPLAAHL